MQIMLSRQHEGNREKDEKKNWSNLTSRHCVNLFSTYCTYIIAYRGTTHANWKWTLNSDSTVSASKAVPIKVLSVNNDYTLDRTAKCRIYERFRLEIREL